MTTLPTAGFAAGDQSDISLQTPTGTIYGTLTRPSKLPAPVILIIPGSGPTDRNGNSSSHLHTQAYAMLAADLAQHGIASVRYDKRGVAASASAMPSEEKLRFTDYVSDAEGWLALLRADNRFIKVTVAGHSEGSLIGMIAAQGGRADAFVSLEGAGRPAYVVLREQLKPKLPLIYTRSPTRSLRSFKLVTPLATYRQASRYYSDPRCNPTLFRGSLTTPQWKSRSSRFPSQSFRARPTCKRRWPTARRCTLRLQKQHMS